MPKVIEPEEPEGFNLTPMIDVTFQLIIFFMLVNDMAQAQAEQLQLPPSDQAIQEKFIDDSLLIVNVLGETNELKKPNGTILISGKVVFEPSAEAGKYDVRRLADLFEQRRLIKAYQETAGDTKFVRYPVLIRADRTTHFEWVQLLLAVASKHGGVTRVQMGTKLGREE